jgi:hypothetical protein
MAYYPEVERKGVGCQIEVGEREAYISYARKV